MALVMPHPASFALDHRVPKSRGGAWVLGNLDLTHNHCNGQKNEASLPEPSRELYAVLLDEAVARYLKLKTYVLSEIAEARRVAHFASGGYRNAEQSYESAVSSEYLQPWSSTAQIMLAEAANEMTVATARRETAIERVRVLQDAWTEANSA